MSSKSRYKLYTTSCGANRYVGCCFFISDEELNEWLREMYMAEGTHIDKKNGVAIAWWLE